MRALLGLLLLAVGCAPAAPEGTFVDDLGRPVGLEGPAERVFPLAPSLTEVIVAAGGLERLVAVSPVDAYPEAVRSLPRIGIFPLDVEALVAARADLALGTVQVNNPAEGDRLAGLGIPAAYLSFETLADVPRALRRVGEMLGTEHEAEAAAASFEEALGRFEAAPAPAPGVLVLIGDRVLYAFGGASYVHEMVRLAGGQSLTERFPGEGVTLSAEFVLTERPDRIVVLAGPDYDPGALARHQPALAALPVVREGRVCGVDPDLVSRPGPRLIDGIEALRACLAAERLSEAP